MHPGWIRELWYIAGLALTFLIIGLIAGHALFFLLLAVLGYLLWHVLNVLRLQHWLRDSKKLQPPVSKGVWGEVFNDLYRLQVRDRKRKRKLARLLNRFQEATSALPDATAVLSDRGDIEWFNDAAQKLLGLRTPGDVGHRVANLVRHPHFIEFLQAGDYTKSVEIPSPVDNGILLTVFIVPYGKEKRLLVARDITRLHHLEQVRRDFVANVSHELRTPLTVINGFLETLSEDAVECPPPWQRSLQLMRQQASRMQNIVNDLLMLSKLETGQSAHTKQSVAVPEILQTLLREARALSAERAHRIELEVDTSLWLQGNHDELHSAFSNLVFNAIQYTPAQGSIGIRWFADAQGAHLVVSDTGEGIAPHHLPRLTERFYRVDAGRSRQSGGTGLGLAIVKHVLNRHGAQLRIHSELGKGSTFTCDFPVDLVLPQPKHDDLAQIASANPNA